MANNFDIYEMINRKIIDLLQQGTVPWKMSWVKAGVASPKSFSTSRIYGGINFFNLLISALANKYSSRYWATYKQIVASGGNVRKGSQSEQVVFWKFINMVKKDESGKTVFKDGEAVIDKVPFLRYYNVFNLNQTEGIPEKLLPADNSTVPVINKGTGAISACEKLIIQYKDKPDIYHGEQKAYYNPISDYINIPSIQTFSGPEEYYSCLFHELVHSTGHENRLDRNLLNQRHGDSNYSLEELIAEAGASYLCAETGIEQVTIENNVAYIQGWLSKLCNDKKFLVTAFGRAQKAVDYIRGDASNCLQAPSVA